MWMERGNGLGCGRVCCINCFAFRDNNEKMKARHRAAKGTKYSYEDHYEDDASFMDSYDDSFSASQGNQHWITICDV